MNQLVDKAVEWRRAKNKMERKYLEMQKIREEIKALMWEQNREEFFKKWKDFEETWSVNQSAFMDYFEK